MIYRILRIIVMKYIFSKYITFFEPCSVIHLSNKNQHTKHILPSTRLLIRMHERNTIKLHVQVFLRMNTWVFETCRRHYNYIKSLKTKSVHVLGSYYISIATISKAAINAGLSLCNSWYISIATISKATERWVEFVQFLVHIYSYN